MFTVILANILMFTVSGENTVLVFGEFSTHAQRFSGKPGDQSRPKNPGSFGQCRGRKNRWSKSNIMAASGVVKQERILLVKGRGAGSLLTLQSNPAWQPSKKI